MRHLKVAWLAGLLSCVVAPSFASAPARASRSQAPKAPFGERRTAFVQGTDGWLAMCKAEGESFGEMAAQLQSLREHATALNAAKGSAEAEKSLAADQERFKAWRDAFLKK